MRIAILQTDIDNAEWASRHAIAAAIADVLLHDHSIELGAGKSAQVGQASRQGAGEQCLQTSLIISQLLWKGGIVVARSQFSAMCSINEQPPGRRREVAGIAVTGAAQPRSSAGSAFHSLQATSQALQPMHNVIS